MMTDEAARNILGTNAGTDAAGIRAAYDALRRPLEQSLQRAPTPSLQAKYQRRVDELEEAFKSLHHGPDAPRQAADNFPRIDKVPEASGPVSASEEPRQASGPVPAPSPAAAAEPARRGTPATRPPWGLRLAWLAGVIGVFVATFTLTPVPSIALLVGMVIAILVTRRRSPKFAVVLLIGIVAFAAVFGMNEWQRRRPIATLRKVTVTFASTPRNFSLGDGEKHGALNLEWLDAISPERESTRPCSVPFYHERIYHFHVSWGNGKPKTATLVFEFDNGHRVERTIQGTGYSDDESFTVAP